MTDVIVRDGLCEELKEYLTDVNLIGDIDTQFVWISDYQDQNLRSLQCDKKSWFMTSEDFNIQYRGDNI